MGVFNWFPFSHIVGHTNGLVTRRSTCKLISLSSVLNLFYNFIHLWVNAKFNEKLTQKNMSQFSMYYIQLGQYTCITVVWYTRKRHTSLGMWHLKTAADISWCLISSLNARTIVFIFLNSAKRELYVTFNW